MEKRVIIAMVLCGAILLLWQRLFPPPHPPTPAPTATAPQASAPSAPSAVAPTAAAPTPGAGASATHPERQVILTTPDARYVLSSAGGTLVHAELLQPQFLMRPGDPSSGHDVVRVDQPGEAPFRTAFPESAFATPPDNTWDVSQPDPETVVFSADVGDYTHIEKLYRVDKTRYRLHLQVTVANRGDKPVDHHLALGVTGRQDPEKRGGGFFGGVSANTSTAVCFVDDKAERQPLDKLGKDPFDKSGMIRWIATDEKFFLLAAVPYPEAPPQPRTCRAKSLGEGKGEVTLLFAGRSLQPHTQTSYAFALFVGPKVRDDLEAVAPGGEEAQLDKAVDVTLAWLSRPILYLLKFFHRFAHNWGLAIVLLTLFIKLLTFYPTQKSLLSAKKMQKLAPKLTAIRKKYENDRQRQSVETMNLYKAHGVSPFGGCLPSLIQMPIWIALYSTLNYAVELYRAPFLAHIHDLTAKDPFYITPLVMGAVMFLQMRMSPSGTDQQQQATMSVMMPIMFTGFSLFLPAGLALYMLTSYLIGIVQQLYVNYLERKGAITA
jgi:YidC/Oxa1 family membrane protein insertase